RHRIGLDTDGVDTIVQEAEALLGEGEVDVVLTGEVAVDGRRAVFDSIRDLPDRDVTIAFGDEKFACGVEDGPVNGVTLPVLTLFDTHNLTILTVFGDLTLLDDGWESRVPTVEG